MPIAKHDSLFARAPCGCIQIALALTASTASRVAGIYREATRRNLTVNAIQAGQPFEWECPDPECKLHRANRPKPPKQQSLEGF